MTERELFEQWAYSNKWNIFRYPKSDYHSKEGQYCDEFVEGTWCGWQASASRQGYKLVPTEPTEDMIRLGECSHHGYDNIDARNVYKTMLEVVK